jgi:Flp pilus assembly protein TadD
MVTDKGSVKLNPLSPFLQWRLGFRYYFTRQWDLAIDHCQNSVELDANYFLAHMVLGGARLIRGKFSEGIQSLEKAAEFAGQGPLALYPIALVKALTGRVSEAQKIIEELQELNQRT